MASGAAPASPSAVVSATSPAGLVTCVANRQGRSVPEVAAVLFDFGGVIIQGPFAAFAELSARTGVPVDAVRQINTRNPDGNAWARAERGELTSDEFAALFAQEAADLGHALPAQEILDILAAMSPRRDAAFPAMLAAIAACRAAGLRLALISNNVRPMSADPDAASLW